MSISRFFKYIKAYPLPLLLSIMFVMRAVGFGKALGTVIDSIIIFFASFSYITTSRSSCSKLVLLFLSYLLIAIPLANPAPVFQSYSRYLAFLLLLLSVSPLFESAKLRLFRMELLTYTTWIVAILSIGSFFCYFLGINLFKTEIDTYIGSGGLFGGLFNHSMMLGPLAGISACFFFSQALKRNSYKYYVLMIPCLGSVLFAASRGAFIATAVALLIQLVVCKGRKAMKMVIIFSTFLVVSFPLWNSALDGLSQKQESRSGANLGAFDSRTSKFECRIDEFKAHPIIGVGFSAIDPNGNDSYGDDGVIEPGSSWLSVLSMSGIIGAIFIICILRNAFKSGIMRISDNMKDYDYSAFLLGGLSLFCIHLIIEGYIFAAGNFLCYYFWLFVGCSWDYKYLKRRDVDISKILLPQYAKNL